MLSNTGNTLIFINIILTLSIIYFSFQFLNKEKRNFGVKKFVELSLYQTTLSLIIFFTLILGFVFSDFSIENVYRNSHTLKPLFYKITGTWGNHEGSL